MLRRLKNYHIGLYIYRITCIRIWLLHIFSFKATKMFFLIINLPTWTSKANSFSFIGDLSVMFCFTFDFSLFKRACQSALQHSNVKDKLKKWKHLLILLNQNIMLSFLFLPPPSPAKFRSKDIRPIKGNRLISLVLTLYS